MLGEGSVSYPVLRKTIVKRWSKNASIVESAVREGLCIGRDRACDDTMSFDYDLSNADTSRNASKKQRVREQEEKLRKEQLKETSMKCR